MSARIRLGVIAALALLAFPATTHAQGIYLPGGGAPHATMGGASTATPIDAIGSLYWNPAAIGRLGRSEVGIGGGFLFPIIDLDARGPGGRAGRTRSDSGTGLASDLGIVYQPDDSRMTFGMGLFTLGGGGVNYPGDTGNPLLSGIGALGNVQGPIYANMTLMQLAPTAAMKVTDRLVVGFGPTVSVALAGFDPAYFSPPDDSNGDGVGTWATATHTRPYWGGGFRAGLVYSVTDRIDVGFGYTSPQWFETWQSHARTELGQPRTLNLNVTLPAIYSWGVGFRPTDRLLLAVDMRYIDYKNADLFGTPLVEGGLGWDSIFAVAVGSRYQLTDRVALSAGYVYNDNPIPSIGTLFNVQAPAITQHTVSVGSTLNLTDAMALSLGYSYGFQNSLTGPVREARGVGVQFDTQVHTLLFGIQIKFGACGKKLACPTPCDYAAATATAPVEPARPATLPGPPAGG
ncbi:MAG TPA: outer membrane protein transport protein [Gemmata sp.]|nr:outer membrane protein transport protein [Gemmata sp.]